MRNVNQYTSVILNSRILGSQWSKIATICFVNYFLIQDFPLGFCTRFILNLAILSMLLSMPWLGFSSYNIHKTYFHCFFQTDWNRSQFVLKAQGPAGDAWGSTGAQGKLAWLSPSKQAETLLCGTQAEKSWHLCLGYRQMPMCGSTSELLVHKFFADIRVKWAILHIQQ